MGEDITKLKELLIKTIEELDTNLKNYKLLKELYLTIIHKQKERE